jgi:hypothetical protein
MQLTVYDKRLLHGANLSHRSNTEAGITVVNRRDGNGLYGHLSFLAAKVD